MQLYADDATQLLNRLGTPLGAGVDTLGAPPVGGSGNLATGTRGGTLSSTRS